MLVSFSSTVSIPELAAAQSLVAFISIASRAPRTGADRCLLAQQPRHMSEGIPIPGAGAGGKSASISDDIVERRAFGYSGIRISAEKQLLSNLCLLCGEPVLCAPAPGRCRALREASLAEPEADMSGP